MQLKKLLFGIRYDFNQYMMQAMCFKAVNSYSFVFDSVPYRYKS